MIFKLSGRIEVQHLPELREMVTAERHGIVLDLSEVTLVDQETVRFLLRCEADSIKLENCPAYIREWIEKERNRGQPLIFRLLFRSGSTLIFGSMIKKGV